MSHSKLLLLIIIAFYAVVLRSQNPEKANTYYKDGYYAKAIPIYQSILKKKPTLEIKTKLANCYRLLNQAEKAATIYRDILNNEKAQPIDYFRFGEVMMMLSQYDSAKIYFTLFSELNPDDERGLMMLKAFDKMKDINPALKHVIVEPFKHNTDADESVPVFFDNGLVFASDRSSGFNLLKQKNQTTGRDYITLYVSEKLGDSAFSKPKELSSKFSELNKNTGNISFMGNRKTAFFCRNSLTPSKNGTYNMQMYSAELNRKGSWGKIKLIPFCTNEQNYMYPSVSPDGKQLFFVMERGDGFGGLDIYVSEKNKKGWSRPENIGDKVNTSGHEGFPYISADNKLYFCSKGHTGYGGYDIFVTYKDSMEGDWHTPQNLGMPVNSAYDDISFAFADSTWGAFTSARSGRGDDIFFFKIKNQGVPDDTLLVSTSPTGKSGFTFDIETTPQPYDSEDDALSVTVDADTINYLTLLNNKLMSGELQIGETFIMDNIRFDSINAVVLNPDIKVEIEKLVSFLLQYKTVSIEIGVHTEGGGEKAVLIGTSEKRAKAISQHMIDKGIKSKRLIAKGYGDTLPLKGVGENTMSWRDNLQNQRIELKILKL